MLTEAWTLESRFSHGGENHPIRETSEDHTSWSAIDVNEDGITLHLTTQWRPHPDQHWPHSNQRPLTNREITEDFTSWSKWRRMLELSVTTQVTQTWSAQLWHSGQRASPYDSISRRGLLCYGETKMLLVVGQIITLSLILERNSATLTNVFTNNCFVYSMSPV